jgi:hypothetical protein
MAMPKLRSIRWWHHVVVVLGLWIVATGWHWPWVSSAPAGLADSSAYLHAFSAVAQGLSPYTHARYLYPPWFAHLGAHLSLHWHAATVAVLLQLLALLAASVLTWISLSLVIRRLGVRLVAAPLLLVALPPIRDSITTGNIAIIITTSALGAFLLWPRAPLAAGVLLGLALAAKPMVLGFLPVLLFQRTLPRRQGWLVAGLASALSLASLALYPHEVLAMLRRIGETGGGRTVSLHATFAQWGLDIPVVAMAVAVGVTGAVVVRRAGHSLGVPSMALISCFLSLAMLPVISEGSLSLGVPIVVAAPVLAARRLAEDWRRTRPVKQVALRNLLLVTLATIAFCGGDTWGHWGELPAWLRGLVMLVPLLALGAATRFCLRTWAADREATFP